MTLGSQTSSRRLAVLGEIGELAQDFGGADQAFLRRFPFLEEHHLHVRPHSRRLAVLADEIDQPVRLRELVVAERDDRALRSGIDLLDIGAAAIALDRRDLEEIAHLVRQHAEAIAQFGGEIVDLVVGVEIGQPPVQRQPHREVGDVILRNQHGHADGDLRRPAVGGRFDHAGLEVEDRLLQHRLVKLEADFLDMAGLFLAEQIAGAADIEVVRRQLESGAQRFQRLQHFQPPLGLRGDLLLRRQREQRIGAQLRAPHPSAQLIELRQPEHVGAVHDQRIGGGNIEAGLDDGGREQDIVLAVIERRHDVLDHRRRHLAMGDRDLHLRHVLVEKVLHAGEIFDARHHVERLAAAIAFAQQRLADHQGIVRRHEGADRQPIDRRRRDDGEIAHPRQRQLQRARDRCRAQRQHMHLGAQLLQPLLVADAEMLLLVDDQKAEIPELDRFAEQRMGADHDIDAAVREASS